MHMYRLQPMKNLSLISTLTSVNQDKGLKFRIYTCICLYFAWAARIISAVMIYTDARMCVYTGKDTKAHTKTMIAYLSMTCLREKLKCRNLRHS